ncbi:hypothetical protein YDYSY3_11910 [Paenibacillus chitinolyticus]|nr:hypothetical protein YDYSY3_11910 [Paenibacillus chitinolyticus]
MAEYTAYGGKARLAAGRPASAARQAAACALRRLDGRRIKSGPVSADNAQPARCRSAGSLSAGKARTGSGLKLSPPGFTAESEGFFACSA